MSTLYEMCFNQLVSGEATASQLEELPPQMLAEMLQSLAKRTKDAEGKLESAEAKLESANRELDDLLQNRYVVNPPRTTDRVGDDMYDRVERVTAKWAANPKRSYADWSTQDIMHKELLWNVAMSAFEFKEKTNVFFSYRQLASAGWKPFHHVISSAMLLYRVLCLFPASVDVDHDRYKVLWMCGVQHIATGETVQFSEWKAAAMISMSNLKTAPKQFEDDVLELLNLLCDARCPPTYDGAVAGCVA